MQLKLLLKSIILKTRILKIFGADEISYRQRYLYFKYKEKYKNEVNNIGKTLVECSNASNKPIYVWTYWNQGLTTMPEIVKVCIGSIQKRFSNIEKYKFILLTSQNLHKYVNLPKYIEDKFQSGTIPIAQYSDIVRTFLLIKYGGYWIDSTVFISHDSNLFDLIENQSLFLFKRLDLSKKYYNKHYISNWFIYSKPNNIILSSTLNLIYRYWKENKKLEDYFIFHTLFAISVSFNKKEFDKIPTYNNSTPHVLQFEMFNQFEKHRYQQILEMTPIHKLNRSKKPIEKSNIYTYNDYIIETNKTN